jgi:hypothetical protein
MSPTDCTSASHHLDWRIAMLLLCPGLTRHSQLGHSKDSPAQQPAFKASHVLRMHQTTLALLCHAASGAMCNGAAPAAQTARQSQPTSSQRTCTKRPCHLCHCQCSMPAQATCLHTAQGPGRPNEDYSAAGSSFMLPHAMSVTKVCQHMLLASSWVQMLAHARHDLLGSATKVAYERHCKLSDTHSTAHHAALCLCCAYASRTIPSC